MSELNNYYKKYLIKIKEDLEKKVYTLDDLFKPVKPKEEYDQEQLAIGTKIELEHVYDEEIASIIARHHLNEFPSYYIYLAKMEQELKNGGK